MDRDGKPPLVRTNRFFGLCLVLCLAALYVWLIQDPNFDRELYDGFSLGFFPTLSVAMMALFAAVLIFDGHSKEESTNGPLISAGIIASVCVVGLGGFVYAYLLPIVGYLILTPIYMSGLAFLLGMPFRLPTIIGVIATTLVIFAIFWTLGYPLPMGILDF